MAARALAAALLVVAAPALADATLPDAAGADGRGAAGLRIGAVVRIVDDGQLYTTIDRTDCMSRWPSEAIKRQTDQEYWERFHFYPRNGVVGVVIADALHCDRGYDGKPVRLLVLRMGERYAVIGSTGVRKVAPVH
jgi:hypothetical protein